MTSFPPRRESRILGAVEKTNTNALNNFRCHCEPKGRGNLTPSLPSPLEGEGEGGGDWFVAPLLAKTNYFLLLD